MSLPGRTSPATTLLELLKTRAHSHRAQPLSTFLKEGDEQVLRYGELNLRARRIGAVLQSVARSGERAVLLYPPSLEYVAGFFGCVYAGLVAVPAYPPEPSRLERTLPRLRAISTRFRATTTRSASRQRSRRSPGNSGGFWPVGRGQAGRLRERNRSGKPES